MKAIFLPALLRRTRFVSGAVVGVLLGVACADSDSTVGPESNSTPEIPADVTVYPDTAALGLHEEIQFEIRLRAGSPEDSATQARKWKDPKVARVKLDPDSITMSPGLVRTFQAAVTINGGKNVASDFRWTATGGSVSAEGKYTAGSIPGRFQVIAAATSGAADTAVVTISSVPPPTLDQIELTPSNASLNTGGTRQFAAVGKASDGATVPVTVTYTATGGTITDSGFYTGGQAAGTFRVIATETTTQTADTATVTIQDAVPTLQAVAITPTSAIVASGAKQQFTVSAKMSDGSLKTITGSYTATGGSISPSGEYTAGATAGSYRVIATELGGKADTAEVTIPVPPTPSSAACARTVNVSTVAALSNATSSALPGDCIMVAAGTYAVGVPSWTRSGTATQPITLQGMGSSATVLTLGGNGGIYLKASHWRIRKLRITNGFFGIQTEGSSYVELDSLEVDNVQQAAINLRYGTNRSVVKNSYIHDTGKGTARYGEGVYIGGYASPGSTSPDDAADDNQVLDNRFGPNVRAEAIDISRGADRVTIRGNTLDGTGTVHEYGYMNSLVGVRGMGHQISDNVLSKGAPHGMVLYEGSATFRRNRIALYNLWNHSAPLGINRAGGSATVGCDNVVTDISAGGAPYNVPCTQ